MANLTFIPNTSGGGNAGLSLEQIPDEVRKDVEEVYAALKTNPGRMRVEFTTLAELNEYVTQVQAYCKLRPAGVLRFRKSPTRGLAKTIMDFRITDPTPNEAEGTTEAIRENVEEVKAAAATGTAKSTK